MGRPVGNDRLDFCHKWASGHLEARGGIAARIGVLGRRAEHVGAGALRALAVAFVADIVSPGEVEVDFHTASDVLHRANSALGVIQRDFIHTVAHGARWCGRGNSGHGAGGGQCRFLYGEGRVTDRRQWSSESEDVAGVVGNGSLGGRELCCIHVVLVDIEQRKLFGPGVDGKGLGRHCGFG